MASGDAGPGQRSRSDPADHQALGRLLGLYDRVRTDGKGQHGWDNCQGPPTLVINPKDCRWGGCAKHGAFPAAPSGSAQVSGLSLPAWSLLLRVSVALPERHR